MDGISELLPFVLDSSVNHLQNYLAACQEHVAFNGKDKKSEDYIKLINVRLNENENRFEGLLILNVALEQCSAETFVDNAKSWMVCSLKGTHEKNQNVVNISFSVLEKLLKMAVKFPEIKKYASINILPSVLFYTRKDINYETVQSFLKFLIVCMQDYSGSCGESNRNLLIFLTRLLDSEPHLLTLAAKCFALLTQIKGKGRDGVPFHSLWSTNQLVLVHTLHHYLDLLFSNVDEIETGHHPPAGNIELLIAKEANNEGLVTERMQFAMKQIRGLSKYLQSMLLGSFPVPKPVMPDIILGLICRGLAVTCNSLGHSTIDSVALKAVLPNVHADLINILIALITCCSRNLLQYGSLICKLVSQELKWTNVQDWPYGFDKPYRQLRSAVYNCLHCWLSVSRSASLIETVIEDIVQFVLQDIHVEKPIIALKARSSLTKKNKPRFNYVSESRNDKLDKELANSGLCLHALKCLQLIIYSSTGFMKSSVCKAIQESVVTLLFEVQNTCDGPPIPYSDNSCRKELYSTLLALCSEPHATFPPPINYALALFKAGLHDSLSEVSVICLNGLSNLEKILHPSAPPLSSALQYIPTEQERHQQKKIEEIENNEIVLRSSTNTKKSINDIPLSEFPNLKNVIVIKVIHDDHSKNENIRESSYDHDDNSMDTSNLSNENSVKSIQKTVINVEDSTAINENSTIGDVILLGNDKVDKEVILSDNDNSVEENDEMNDDNKSEDKDSNDNISNEELEKHSKVVTSVFEKINGICSKDNDEENKLKCEPVEEVIQYQESQGLITVTDSSNDLCNEPPLKKMKTVSEVILNDSPKKLNLENSDDLVTVSKENNMNGDSNSVHDEDDMMNCFVDVV